MQLKHYKNVLIMTTSHITRHTQTYIYTDTHTHTHTHTMQLKHYKNVLVMTTSNITEAIDLAFVDRADIKQYIGLPSAQARYQVNTHTHTYLAHISHVWTL